MIEENKTLKRLYNRMIVREGKSRETLRRYLEGVLSFTRFMGALTPDEAFQKLKQEKDEMFSIGWVADYPHPQDFLEVLFRSGAESNYGEYADPEVDTLLKEASVETDYDLSLALYQQAEQRMVEDAACLPLYFGKNYILVKPYVKGYKLNPQGTAMLNTVSIEPH